MHSTATLKLEHRYFFIVYSLGLVWFMRMLPKPPAFT